MNVSADDGGFSTAWDRAEDGRIQRREPVETGAEGHANRRPALRTKYHGREGRSISKSRLEGPPDTWGTWRELTADDRQSESA